MDPMPKRVKVGEEPMAKSNEEVVSMETDEQPSAGEARLPYAPDPQAFFDNPTAYDASSPCLAGTIDGENNTALICAVKTGAEGAFFRLLEGKEQGYVNFQNSKGVTALNIASHRGNVQFVTALLEKAKADVNIPNISGSTSLIQASHFGHTPVVELLLQHHATVDRPNLKGTTALMRAAQEGHLGVVEALLRAGADVNKRNHERMNALMLASQRGHDAIVKLLIRHGADIDCQTVQGSTALMLACKRQHEAVVEVLLTAGSEMFITDSRGRTARDTANKRGNKNIIAMLQSRKQVRLMQVESRIQRTYVMARLYELQSQKRACPVEDAVRQYPVDSSVQVLYRAFELPFSLFQCVAKFIPWPRMWDSLLPMLHKRCNIDANEAIRGALSIMDEVLTDLLVSDDPLQEMHLIRASRQPHIVELLRGKYKMPPDLIDTITRWSDVQSVLSRFERGVTFSSAVADRAVKDAARLYSWYKFGGDDPEVGGPVGMDVVGIGPGQAAAAGGAGGGDVLDDLDHDGVLQQLVAGPPFGAMQPAVAPAHGGMGGGGGGVMVGAAAAGGGAADGGGGHHYDGDYGGFESGSSDNDLE